MRRGAQRFAWTLVLLSLVVATSPLLLERAPSLPPPRNCPERLVANPSGSARLLALLAATTAGRGLHGAHHQELLICFGELNEPGIMPDGTILLDSRDDDAESAARLGHLLQHYNEGLPYRDDDLSEGCDEIVGRAIRAEARAHSLELELRRELGVDHPRRPLSFAADFDRVAPARRLELLEDFFRAHPEGGGGAPGFVKAYQRRCEERRRQ